LAGSRTGVNKLFSPKFIICCEWELAPGNPVGENCPILTGEGIEGAKAGGDWPNDANSIEFDADIDAVGTTELLENKSWESSEALFDTAELVPKSIVRPNRSSALLVEVAFCSRFVGRTEPPKADWKSAKSPPSLEVAVAGIDETILLLDLAVALVKSPKSAEAFSSDLGSKSSETSTPGEGGAGFVLKELLLELLQMKLC
jgi:hypothetical protein